MCERLEREGGEERTISEADTLIVRKALSGVARTKQKVGMTGVAKMLHGASDKQLTRWGLDRLSTHGLLSDHPVPWIQALLRRLITAGLLDITPTQYPMLMLTKAGVAVMKGEAPARVLTPPEDAGLGGKKKARSASSKAKREPPPGMDGALFEKLREARLELAKEQGVPAYVVCHDRTLMEIAAAKPVDAQALLAVPGMGPARVEAYGERFLEVVAS